MTFITKLFGFFGLSLVRTEVIQHLVAERDNLLEANLHVHHLLRKEKKMVNETFLWGNGHADVSVQLQRELEAVRDELRFVSGYAQNLEDQLYGPRIQSVEAPELS